MHCATIQNKHSLTTHSAELHASLTNTQSPTTLNHSRHTDAEGNLPNKPPSPLPKSPLTVLHASPTVTYRRASRPFLTLTRHSLSVRLSLLRKDPHPSNKHTYQTCNNIYSLQTQPASCPRHITSVKKYQPAACGARTRDCTVKSRTLYRLS